MSFVLKAFTKNKRNCKITKSTTERSRRYVTDEMRSVTDPTFAPHVPKQAVGQPTPVRLAIFVVVYTLHARVAPATVKSWVVVAMTILRSHTKSTRASDGDRGGSIGRYEKSDQIGESDISANLERCESRTPRYRKNMQPRLMPLKVYHMTPRVARDTVNSAITPPGPFSFLLCPSFSWNVYSSRDLQTA